MRDRVAFAGTVRITGSGPAFARGIRLEGNGRATVHGACPCGTVLTRRVLGGHLTLRPVCAACKPAAGSPSEYEPEPAGPFTLHVPTAPGEAFEPADLSAAVRAAATLLADDATAGRIPAPGTEFADLARALVAEIYPYAAAAALHAGEHHCFEHSGERGIPWGRDASKFLRDWAWAHEETFDGE